MTEAKTFSKFNIINSVFRSARLSANIKLTLHIGTDQISDNLGVSRLGISGRHLPLKIAEHAKQGSPDH
jgi:hypothetical protein